MDPDTDASATPRRLVALDLDGTLLGPGGSLSPRNAAAVRAAAAAGWYVVLATGRPPHLVGHLAVELARSVTHVIGGNGSMVGTFPAEPGGDTQLLHLSSFDHDTARRLVSHLRAADAELGFALATDAGFGHEPGFAERMPAPVDVDPIDDVLALGGTIAFKLLVFHPTRSVAELTEVLPPVIAEVLPPGEHFTVTHMGADAAEIGPAVVDKCAGLRWLCEHLGVDRADVVAFGDEGNDLTMIEWVGEGYAMENANDAVKAVADAIAPHHADDGVAVVLERLLG